MLGEALKSFPVKMMNKLKKGYKQKNSIMTLERKAGIIKETVSKKNEKSEIWIKSQQRRR